MLDAPPRPSACRGAQLLVPGGLRSFEPPLSAERIREPAPQSRSSARARSATQPKPHRSSPATHRIPPDPEDLRGIGIKRRNSRFDVGADVFRESSIDIAAWRRTRRASGLPPCSPATSPNPTARRGFEGLRAVLVFFPGLSDNPLIDGPCRRLRERARPRYRCL